MAKKKARKAKKAKRARKAAKAKRVRIRLKAPRTAIERGIKTLQRAVDQAEGRASKKTLGKARKRLKRLQNAVRELKAECPDNILDPRFIL